MVMDFSSEITITTNDATNPLILQREMAEEMVRQHNMKENKFKAQHEEDGYDVTNWPRSKYREVKDFLCDDCLWTDQMGQSLAIASAIEVSKKYPTSKIQLSFSESDANYPQRHWFLNGEHVAKQLSEYVLTWGNVEKLTK